MLELIDSPVSGRGRSLDAGRDSTPYSKVATSPARASATSTTEIGSNDVSSTVLTDVRPMASVIFWRTHVRTHSSALGLRAAVTARHARARSHFLYSRSREFETRRALFTARTAFYSRNSRLDGRSLETMTGTTTSK